MSNYNKVTTDILSLSKFKYFKPLIKYNKSKQQIMFPNSYSFNPGVGTSDINIVLDPITMTPMISGSSFTVNPLGVPSKPQQKIWQKMFIKDIPMQCSNDCMIKLLSQFGQVKNFKRMSNQRSQLLPFCYFDLETGQQILRMKRLFKNIRILDKTLELKISPQTQTFIKQWTAIQKDEWRKKLLAPGMNEAKQYASIQDYHERDDGKYKQRIQQKLRQVNSQVKKCAIQKMREQEKKQHPRQKQRQRQKKRIQEELARNFQQQEDYLLKRQRNKEKQYRKMKQRERSTQKRKAKKLQKQLSITAEEEQKRIAKFLTPQRIKAVQKQQMEDIQAILQQNPPLPQQQQPAMQQAKRIKVYAGQSFEIVPNQNQQNYNRTQDQARIQIHNGPTQRKQVKINKMFEDWDKEEVVQEQVHQYELKLPQLQQIQKQKQRQLLIKRKTAQLEGFVPKNKNQLWQYVIDWDKLSKSVVLERNIRPWLAQQSLKYMGSIQEKFIALVQKRLFSKSKPDKVIKVMQSLIDQDAQQFVVKLWKALILQDLKLKHGVL